MNAAPFSMLRLLALVLFLPVGDLYADGGVVRLSQRRGRYQITAFTSPTPVRVGPVDISVFVQDAATGEPVPGARILVRAMPRDRPEEAIQQPASNDKATNKLFQAAILDLSEPGWWDVALVLDGLGEWGELSFEMVVDEPLPRLWEMAPWIAWPGVAILLFLMHQGLLRRKARQNGATKKANSHE